LIPIQQSATPTGRKKIRQRLTTLADGYEQDFALW
jgi:hypothetical protein